MIALPTRLVMTAGYRAKQLVQKITGRRTFGVHGVVLTRAHEIVLVRLTYAPGWQLPGGGLKRGETAKEGLLRELREEIGLRSWGSIEGLAERRRSPRMPLEQGAIFVVRGATFRPRWSLEIAETRAFAATALPADMSPWTRAALDRAGLTPLAS